MIWIRFGFGLFILFIFLFFYKKPAHKIDSEKADRAEAKIKGISYDTLIERRAKRKARTIPKAIRNFVLQRDQYQCKSCKSSSKLTIDHIIPYSKGGSHEPENLQVLCQKCNWKKGNKVF